MEDPKNPDSDTPVTLVTREELYKMVWAEPMVKVAKEFAVSSSYLARVCSWMNIPRPERGYWAKLAVGKRLPVPALPETRPGDQLYWGRGVDPSTIARASPNLSVTPQMRPSRKSRSPHPLVLGAKAHFEAGRTSYWSTYLKPYKRKLIDLTVSKSGLDRALAFADTLFRHLEDNGYPVVLAPDHERFSRADVDHHDIPKKKPAYRDSNELWAPHHPTVVYLGTLPIGLTIIEISEYADAKSVDGGYERLEPAEAKRLQARGQYSLGITKHDFPSNRLCVQAYSPYWRARWTKQWREAKGEDLRKRAPAIMEELVSAAPDIIKLVEEGERQAEIERREREEDCKRREREETERRVADARKKSKDQLLRFISTWAEAKRIDEFFSTVAAGLTAADGEARHHLEQRLNLARRLIGETDALKGLRQWKSPDEWQAEQECEVEDDY